MPRRVTLLAGCLGAGMLVTACLSPTLPLPPPSKPDIGPPDASGFVQIQGTVVGESTVFAENLENGQIVGQRTDSTGDYALTLEGAVNDTLVLWYRIGTENSQSRKLTVPSEEESTLEGMGGAGTVPAPE